VKIQWLVVDMRVVNQIIKQKHFKINRIFFGVFSSSKSIVAFDVFLRISAVYLDGETDERKERKEKKKWN
jgi:hypothetical protein